MTEAVFSDIDKKVYPKDECYLVKVRSPESTWIEFHVHKTQQKETIQNAIKLALKNNCKWFKWGKDETGNLKKNFLGQKESN